MKSRKLGTMFLSMLLVFTLLVAVGCGKEEEEPGTDNPTPASTNKPTDNPNNKGGNGETTKTVKLLKRNGVEWKENTKINSKVGAKSYKVVWGDTLRLIAKTWRVNTRKLARYNNIKNPDLIEVGQVIYNYAYKK